MKKSLKLKHADVVKVPATAQCAGNREQWAARIREVWQKGVESIIEIGQLLVQAKAAIGRAEWLKLVETDLRFGARTAQKLMAIAENPVISNAKHVPLLPVSWGTLSELTKLPEEKLRSSIADGTINPKMERSDAVRLVRTVTGNSREAPGGPSINKVRRDFVTAVRAIPVEARVLEIERLLRELDLADYRLVHAKEEAAAAVAEPLRAT